MSMADRDGFIWHDGKLVPWREATTHVLTHSLHYGLAVFEGLRAYKTAGGTAIFRLKEHTDRLFNSAHIYMMQMPYDKETLMEAHKEVVRANKLDSCYLRPIAFYGSEKMGVSPKGAKVHVSIAAWPWGAYLGEEGLANGIRVKTSSYARHHVNVSMCRAKYSGTYANSILANMEATEHGYDEALLLDVDGFVAEGAGENLFVVKDGQIYEPEIASALVGITRATVIQLAKELGYEVKAKRLTRDDLYIADEAFFSGTAAEVTPIREVDGRQIGAGRRGPLTEKIQSLFFDVVNGRVPAHQGLADARLTSRLRWRKAVLCETPPSPPAPGRGSGSARFARNGTAASLHPFTLIHARGKPCPLSTNPSARSPLPHTTCPLPVRVQVRRFGPAIRASSLTC
jgi:branched-chain amino acid aminotransferase